jgi:riboflavin kinase/FMN adenylyltransferase
MEIILGIEQLKRPLLNPVVTLGNFDGVHLGHQKIFNRAKEEAARLGGEAVVITFEPHPLKVLAPRHCPPLLTPFRKKMILIEESGMDVVLCIEFTPAFSKTSPLDFVKNVLVDKVGARKIIVGYNYHFGRAKEGNAEALKSMGKLFNVAVEVVQPLKVGDTVVSSSKVRELIQAGKVEEASKLLGRDYLMVGKVVVGAKRGHALLGFPTANLEISDELHPQPGVYAVQVIWNHRSFHGVANVGSNPTFETGSPSKVSVEVHILDFDREIYGEEIQVNFRRRIRDEVRFDSVDQLIAQIKKDIEWAKENVFNTIRR